MENLIPLAGAIGMGCGAAYFWNVGNISQPKPYAKIKDFTYICLILISVALSLSLVIPKAPYSDQKSVKKNNLKAKKSSCYYGTLVLKEFFTFKVLFKIIFHVLPMASIQAMLEFCMFLFLFNNTIDKE
jgi:hypothetical protein